jgi:hypothetical protein
MNQIIRSSQTRLPAPEQPSRALSTIIALYHGRLNREGVGRYSISSQQMPEEDEGRALRARLTDLETALAPGNRDAMTSSIAAMFIAFPSARQDAETARTTLAMYVSRVVNFPNWAVDGACKAAVSRASPFPPSAGEFLALCEARLVDARLEKSKIEAIVNADVFHDPDEGEKAKVSERFRELMEDLKLNAPFDDKPKNRPMNRKEAAAWLETDAARVPAPPISDNIRKTLNIGE